MREISIGLARSAELVYRTMLGRVRWQRVELAQALGWSEDEVRRVVENLHSDGLVSASADEPGAIRAVEPAVALPAVAARTCRASGDGLIPTIDALDRFVAAHERTAEPHRDCAETGGIDHIGSCVERLAARATDRLTLLVPTYTPGSFEFAKWIIEAVLRRGVGLRLIWSAHLLANPAVEAYATWLLNRDVVPRTVEYVPCRTVVVDRTAAVELDPVRGVRFRRRPAALEPLWAVADRLWANGTEVQRVTVTRPETSSHSRDEMVLRLLAKGLTDDAVARRIGVSVRTVRNDVASAMSVLDARSRFQAGVLAAQRGFI
jgi:DNA-binding CsgD family transcriptional regulator